MVSIELRHLLCQEVIVFNRKSYLLAFDNGVYDLVLNCFRDGIPNDRITMSTRCEYIEYNWESSVIKDILAFLDEIFNDTTQRDYVLNILANSLNGDHSKQKFYIFQGTGCNGKSKLLQLFKLSIGDYGGDLAAQVLTSVGKTNGLYSSDVQENKSKRFLEVEETNRSLNGVLIKKITRGEEILVKNKKGWVGVQTQFTPILTCNKLPKMSNWNQNLDNILEVIEFKSTFDGSISGTYLSTKFQEWKSGFIWILLEYYKKH